MLNELPLWLLPVLISPFIGSFIGVLIERLPKNRPVIFARSACDTCHHSLSFADLIPVFSYIISGRKCRYCNICIKSFYICIEFLSIFVAMASVFSTENPAVVWQNCILGWVLLGLSWIDARHFIIPNVLIYPLLIAGLFFGASISQPFLFDCVIGAIVGFGAFKGIAMIFRKLRGYEGLGSGDAKLIAVAGAWVGWQSLPDVIFLSAMFGLTFSAIESARGKALARNTKIPFAPFLSFAFWLVKLVGPFVFGGF